MDLSFLIWLTVIGLIVLLLQRRAASRGEPYSWLYILFFFSGFPALIYQIVWQRALFSIYGVNIQSVTMVVTAFMLGLGLGSLAGGRISVNSRLPLLAIFGIAELGIAAFGAVSLPLFHWVAGYTAGASPFATAVITFLLLFIPTCLMGSTLPVLVAHMVRKSGNVGRSVGQLYFVNTMGSAIACFVAAAFLMRQLGETGSVISAAVLNLCIGITVLALNFSRSLSPAATSANLASPGLTSAAAPSPAMTPAGVDLTSDLDPANSASSAHSGSAAGNSSSLSSSPAEVLREAPAQAPFFLGVVTASLAGFIALGYELLWYRVISFATGGLAKSFAVLLGTYLAGIAAGSALAQKLCRLQSSTTARGYFTWIGLFVVAANLAGFMVVPFTAATAAHWGWAGALPLVFAAAALLGAVFPLIAHATTAPDARSGQHLSYLYLGNIVGSAAGSFVMGFILMDSFPLQTLAAGLAVLGVLTGAALLAAAQVSPRRLMVSMAACVAIAGLVWLSAPALFVHVYEKLQFKQRWAQGSPGFTHVVETRSGVITVTPDNTIFGGGIYDGKFNTDLVHDSNLIVRAYAISAIHPAPRNVLMIGLSSGSWAQVIASHPQVEKLTIVEINPGYLRLIPQYPEVASVLKNPKVEIVIDDGRRWLLRNPASKFDMIVANTTYHWRSGATNLLSRDFLELARKHLNPGGVHYYNTTQSLDVLLTAATVFPYSLRVMNLVAVSDSPLKIDKDRWEKVLLDYRIDGRPVLDMNRAPDRQALQDAMDLAANADHANLQWEAIEYSTTFLPRLQNQHIVTDDNMGSEWQQ